MAVYRVRFSSISKGEAFVLECIFDTTELDTAPLSLAFASEAAIAEALAKAGLKWDSGTPLPDPKQWFTLTTHRFHSLGFTKVP